MSFHLYGWFNNNKSSKGKEITIKPNNQEQYSGGLYQLYLFLSLNERIIHDVGHIFIYFEFGSLFLIKVPTYIHT